MKKSVTLAAMQLKNETTLETILNLDLSTFKYSMSAIRSAYNEMHHIEREKNPKSFDEDKAYNEVLKKAKEIRKNALENLNIELTAEQAVDSAIKKLSSKLGVYTKQNWLKSYAERISTVLQSSLFKKDCERNDLQPLLVAQNAVWMGNELVQGKTVNRADDIVRHGLSGYDWIAMNEGLFNYTLIYDYVKESESMSRLNVDDYVEVPKKQGKGKKTTQTKVEDADSMLIPA